MEDKKEIIKKVVEMMRLEEINYIAMILTDEEELMSKNHLKAHLHNKFIRDNNDRLDKILEANEIKLGKY